MRHVLQLAVASPAAIAGQGWRLGARCSRPSPFPSTKDLTNAIALIRTDFFLDKGQVISDFIYLRVESNQLLQSSV